MKSKVWRSRALSMCLIVATIATYSMVALATDDNAGELLVTGKHINGVLVNGEVAQTGRSIFSSSTIVTPENTNATVNLGKIGNVSLAPDTIVTLSFTQNVISGELVSGQLTVLSAENAVNIKMPDGKVVKLNAGETAAAGVPKQDDDDDSDGGNAWIIWALIFGGAAAGILLAATTNNNDLNLGGATTVVSPAR